MIATGRALHVCTACHYTEDAIVHHGVLKPGIAFLHKPFTSDTLNQKIREVLQRDTAGRAWQDQPANQT